MATEQIHDTAPQEGATQPNNADNQVEAMLPIGGMTCASCVRRVEKSLAKVEGVSDVGVNLATERATVKYDPAKVDMAALKAAVERAGYTVPTEEAMLPIEGMTCASCVRRVEKSLAKLPGVELANVNLATEQATVRYNPAMVGRDEFRKAVEKAGYAVRAEQVRTEAQGAPGEARDVEAERRAHELADVQRKFIFALVAGLVVMGIMFLPLPWPMETRNYIMLLIATPVQFWAGWSFYTGTWRALRHLSTNMNTLIAVGTSA
ncbi:MAG TPA: copper ion binding protein, partial [Chloroflexia bacterium]|nr:copper ion binding protein [Chloroflexia bacterium]